MAVSGSNFSLAVKKHMRMSIPYILPPWGAFKNSTLGKEATIINKPILGRHIPYCLENGDTIIQNGIILVTDQHDGLVYACQATTENLKLLKVIPTFAFESSASPMLVVSLEPQVDSNQITKSSGTKWSKDAVLFLIKQWKKNSSKFASTTIRNDEVWKDITKALEDAGFTGYTWKQAQDKWKYIRKGYMKMKDNIGDKSSSASRITCKFFDELDEVFRKSPSVEPISVASSRNFTSLPSEDTDSDSDKKFSQY
ncbi:uncharacterized protein LOC118646357 [Monomorium pharaonis]|uniref:uncharacterized protein LOC118646357 n=1 Tax=Monomorium pharaonis TaxID=307658 RepID=UPI001746FFA2|nr:uncharacterized protein LOC118646357 [Monomorium pharaonis]